MGTKWKRVATEPIYGSEYVNLFEDQVLLPDGVSIKFLRLEMRDFVVVIPVDGNGNIIMVKNHRYPADRKFLELPSGHIGKHESVVECARRELAEETGYTAENIVRIGWYYPVARSLQRAFLFFATGLKEGVPSRDAMEKMVVVKMPVDKTLKMLHEGKFKHAPTIIALSLAAPLLEEISEQ